MGQITAAVFRFSLSLCAVCAASFAQGALSRSAVDGNAASAQSSGSDALPDAERIPKRGIFENEAAVVNVCASYVEAQLLYFRSDHDAGGFLVFAQRIRSTPGRRDGLYWELDSSENESPVGPGLAAAAVTENPPTGESRPFFGYYFKVLLSQGPDAPGGARDYRVDGRLIAGFALVAWPAEYGVSGVHSFLVNHLGDVFAKDLGPDTHRTAVAMPAFAPDRTWTKVLSSADDR